MASKNHSTANSGLFGSSLEGQLSFEQLSGPRLFTPVPLPQPANSILQCTPTYNAPSVPGMHAPPISNSGFTNSTPPTRPMMQSTPYRSKSSPQSVNNSLPVYSQGMATPNTMTTHANTNLPVGSTLPIHPAGSIFTPSSNKTSYDTPPPLVQPQYYPPPQRPMQIVPPQQTLQNQQEQPLQQYPSQTVFHPTAQNVASPPSPDYNISPFPGNTQSVTQTNVQPATPPSITISPITAHWFYFKNSMQWIPFSYIDSNNLERLFHSSATVKCISTDGGRYDVDLISARKTSVYWNEAPCLVRRCTWFYKGDGESKLIPYETEAAEKLESEYVAMMKKAIFNIRVDLSPGKFVIFHNPNVLVQYVSNVEHMDWTGEDSKVRPKVVKRGIMEIQEEIERGEPAEVDHLVFVVHGIGPVADLRMRSIIECVDDLRRNSFNLTSTHGFKVNGEDARRVEFLPIQWHSCLREDRYGIDRQLKTLSLPSINKLRNFTNETLTDILFFTSPMYCQTICDTVVSEMNRLFKLFHSRNPTYTGRVSTVGHSLGTCILFDILANQKDKTLELVETETYEDFGEMVENSSSVNTSLQPPVTKPMTEVSPESPEKQLPDITELLSKLNMSNLESMFAEEQIDTETLMMCSEGELRDLGIPFGPRKKISAYIKQISSSKATNLEISPTSISTSTSQCSTLTRGTQTRVAQNGSSLVDNSVQCAYKLAAVGTGQPLVVYPKLEFETDALFCLGSPLGLFLTCRGVSSIGPEFKLPKCQNFLNIFHPVYRLEPLLNELIDIPPVLIPHHKGRKRFHLEIKENLSRVSANLKSGFIDAVNRTWSSINDFAKAHRGGGEQHSQETAEENVESSSSSDVTQESIDSELVSKEQSLDFGKLNNGRRVDYVLQEKPFEVLNEYLFALSSHTCYWTSEDTALLILNQIYVDV